MNYFNKIKEYLLKKGSKKGIQDLIIIFIIGVIIVLVANFFMPQESKSPGYVEVNTNNEKVADKSQVNLGGYEENLKSELVDVLSQIKGAGRVKAMIYFETGRESIPAFNQNASTKVTEEDDGNGGKRVTNENNDSTTVVTTNDGGGNKPFIVKEVKPKVSGVIVIAEGADDPNVKYKLYEAVKTVFNIDQYKVNIYPMTKIK